MTNSNDMNTAVTKLCAAIVENHHTADAPQISFRKIDLGEINARFAASVFPKKGRKYIKIMRDGSVWGFVVNIHDDDKFSFGDILKPASYNTPARNTARGNVFGGYTPNWLGPRA